MPGVARLAACYVFMPAARAGLGDLNSTEEWTVALAAYTEKDSVAYRLRRRRFARFMKLFESLPKPVRILDVGGTQVFWETMGFADRNDCHVTLLNLFENSTSSDRFTSAVGDARDLSRYEDREFDVVFSNSVIEHVGGPADQLQMASEVRRAGRSYFVQTPNFYFPIEPHFQFPAFQFLPVAVRKGLVRRFSLGPYRRAKDDLEASDWVNEIRLLTRRELARLFPEAQIVTERFLGLAKSFMAISEPAG